MASDKAISDFMAATRVNVMAIEDLGSQLGLVCQEVVACGALKPIVDKIWHNQLANIPDTIKWMKSKFSADIISVVLDGVACLDRKSTREISDGVNYLDTKFTEGLDMVNIRINKSSRCRNYQHGFTRRNRNPQPRIQFHPPAPKKCGCRISYFCWGHLLTSIGDGPRKSMSNVISRCRFFQLPGHSFWIRFNPASMHGFLTWGTSVFQPLFAYSESLCWNLCQE